MTGNQSKITSYFESDDDESYKLWNGPSGYDTSTKRTNKDKHLPHEQHVLCKFEENCEFNERDVDDRTIYKLNRHFIEDHAVDMENQNEKLDDIFTGFSKTNFFSADIAFCT